LYNSVTKEDRIVKTLRTVHLDLFRDLTSVKLYSEVFGAKKASSQSESWEAAAGILVNQKLLLGIICGVMVSLGLFKVVLCRRDPSKEDARTVDLTVDTDAIETMYMEEEREKPYYVTSAPLRSARSTRSVSMRSMRSQSAITPRRSAITPRRTGGEQSSES